VDDLIMRFMDAKREYQGHEFADRTVMRRYGDGYILALPCKGGMMPKR